ncbi:hypothetical protein BpHYR1_041461, partial [Brachionus plicatilis]
AFTVLQITKGPNPANRILIYLKKNISCTHLILIDINFLRIEQQRQVRILAEIGLNQLKPVYCLDLSKVNGCKGVNKILADFTTVVRTLYRFMDKTNEVEDEHFDYFFLKVVRLVFGLLGDQLVDNDEQTPTQLDHVTSLLFLPVGDQRGDKVAKGHQMVRVHTFCNEYFDCLESVSEQRAASALAFNTVQNSLEHFEPMKQLHIVPVTHQQLRLISAERSCQKSKSLTKHSNAFALYTPLTYLPLPYQTASENETGETLDGGVHELDIGCHGNQCQQKAGAAQTLHSLAHRHRLKHPHAHKADHYAANRLGRALQLHGCVRPHSQRRHTLIARFVQLFVS